MFYKFYLFRRLSCGHATFYQLDNVFVSFTDDLSVKCEMTEAELNQQLLSLRFKSYLSAELKHGNPYKSKLP